MKDQAEADPDTSLKERAALAVGEYSAHLRPGSRFQHQNLHYVHTAVLFAIYSVCCIKMIQNEAQCFLFPKN